MTDIVCLSDTHTYHSKVNVPEGDILVHSGDFCGSGNLLEVSSFLDWMESLPHKLKIVVPGNHDIAVQDSPVVAEEFASSGVKLLIDEDYTDMSSGLTFYGVPWTPDFFPDRWAFQQGENGTVIWDAVPTGVDILISHGPPYGCMDQIIPHVNEHLGSVSFRDKIRDLQSSLKYIICGHIHGGYGQTDLGPFGVPVVNASICTESYIPSNLPIVVTI